MSREIEDLDLFMMCERPRPEAYGELSEGYHFRKCRPDELDAWKRLQIDDPQYYDFIIQYVHDVYRPPERFFEKCLVVCDERDNLVGSCFVWKAYGKIDTIHWFKVAAAHRGRGIGRALLSVIMRDAEYPMFLHTHPGSYNAIKLYSDMGFGFIAEPVPGNRRNGYHESQPYIKAHIPEAEYAKLRVATAPQYFFDIVGAAGIDEF